VLEYLLGWMARAVQMPNTPGEVAVVMRGAKGTGKTIFADVFGALFGRHYWAVADAKYIVGNFNAHLRPLPGDEPKPGKRRARSNTRVESRVCEVLSHGAGLGLVAKQSNSHAVHETTSSQTTENSIR
jgi:hypothetical protein